MTLAAIGLILSVVVHLYSLLGPNTLFKKKAWALRECPKWMKYLAYFLLGYASINFMLLIVGLETVPIEEMEVRSSGYWMAFYSAAMAILYSAIHHEASDENRAKQ